MTDNVNPSDRIDQMIAELDDWRGKRVAEIRKIMLGADPAMIEEWKWMGSPTFSCDGLIAVADAHKSKVKVTFAHGAKLDDPDGIFNGKDNGKTRRSIDIFEGDKIDSAAFKKLVKNAIAYNRSHLKKNADKPSKK